MKAEEARSLTFDQLIAHYQPYLGYVRTAYIRHLDADDIEQEAKIVMWKCHERVRRGLRLRVSFDAFMRQAVTYRFIDLSRSAARKPIQCPLEDADHVSDNSREAFAEIEFRADLESVPMSDNAKLLVGIILSDVRDYRDSFLRQRDGSRGRVGQYKAAQKEIAAALYPAQAA